MRNEYTDEFKRLKVAQYRDLVRLKKEGYIVYVRHVMGKFAQLGAKWSNEIKDNNLPDFKHDTSMFEIKVDKEPKKYTCLCCGKEFTSLTVRKFCSSHCGSKGNWKKKSSICFDCKNYFKCLKFKHGTKVVDCMLEYEFKENNEILAVYKCKLFKKGE